MSSEMIKGAMLQLLATGFLLGGVMFLLFAGFLTGETLFQTASGFLGIGMLFAVFWHLMSKAYPESINNPFT